jgi:hypothetical protein
MEFEALGKRYYCPLVDYQARTQTMDPARVEAIPA